MVDGMKTGKMQKLYTFDDTEMQVLEKALVMKVKGLVFKKLLAPCQTEMYFEDEVFGGTEIKNTTADVGLTPELHVDTGVDNTLIISNIDNVTGSAVRQIYMNVQDVPELIRRLYVLNWLNRWDKA